jgi:hypothetical protein
MITGGGGGGGGDVQDSDWIKFMHWSLLLAVAAHMSSLFLAAIYNGAMEVKFVFKDFNPE